MAIDTAEKRRSASAVGSRRGKGVTPNASKPVGWRQQVGWGYSGIAPSPPGADDPWTATGTFAVPSATGSFASPSATGTFEDV